MDEKLLRRPAMRLGVGLQHQSEQAFRRGRLEMKLVVSGLPRSVGTAEDNTVSLVEKHLRRAAGMTIGVVRQALVDHADVTDPRSNVGQPPRRLGLRLVVKTGREIPGDRCSILCLAHRITGLIEESVGAIVVSRTNCVGAIARNSALILRWKSGTSSKIASSV